MIGLTKRSHVAPKMQHVTFCDSIVRFDWCRTNRIDSVCGVTWIPLSSRDGSMIAWGRGEGETLSIHVVSTQCARGLTIRRYTVSWSFHGVLACFAVVCSTHYREASKNSMKTSITKPIARVEFRNSHSLHKVPEGKC